MMQHHPARADRNPFVTGFLLLFAADILFLPIILPIPVPVSALVIAPWYLISIGKVPKALLALCILGIVLVLASYLLGQNNYVSGAETYLERFVNTGILMFMFGSYALVQTDVAEREKLLEYALLGFIVFSFVMSLVFFASPNLYFAIRSFWTFSGDEIFYTDLTTLANSMGLGQVFTLLNCRNTTACCLQSLPDTQTTQNDMLNTVLDAHRTLISLNSNNRAMFEPLVKQLEREERQQQAAQRFQSVSQHS